MTTEPELLNNIEKIRMALERLAPPLPKIPDFTIADAFVWDAEGKAFQAVLKVNRVPLELLEGITFIAQQLLANTQRFATGLPANNALLWGARGMGKSSLIKAVHAEVVNHQLEGAEALSARLKLIEIHREDIHTLPRCLAFLRDTPERFIVFCDDLSFDLDDTSYKSLKAALEGGLEGRPENVIFYATSNRRHLMPRDMVENERSTAIRPSEAVEEKVSLSDRFGLWLGFHHGSQDQYLQMVRGYARYHALKIDDEVLRAEALAWAIARGSRSGRVAWQYIQDLAGRLGKHLKHS